MKPRQIARELALLSVSQLLANPKQLEKQQLSGMVIAAIRVLEGEVQEALETATAELRRGNDRLNSSQNRTIEVQSARAMVSDAIEITQTAIDRVATALHLPEFILLSNESEVRAYALEILSTVNHNLAEIDEILTKALYRGDEVKNWQLNRLPRVDRDILRIAVAEIAFLDMDERVAINEAIELAKRYSDEEGHRFINGVLRRVSDQRKAKASQI